MIYDMISRPACVVNSGSSRLDPFIQALFMVR